VRTHLPLGPHRHFSSTQFAAANSVLEHLGPAGGVGAEELVDMLRVLRQQRVAMDDGVRHFIAVFQQLEPLLRRF